VKPLSATGITIGTVFITVSSLSADKWQLLKEDGLHDPSNPSLEILQEPTEALGALQPDSAGNKVNWVTALQAGEIHPRGNLDGDKVSEILELDIVMTATTPLRHVIFPHKPHTEWMTCSTCHEELFVSKIGANPINMGRILAGEYCGRCHGAVSFPLTECDRCHSVKPENITTAPPSGAAIEREQ